MPHDQSGTDRHHDTGGERQEGTAARTAGGCPSSRRLERNDGRRRGRGVTDRSEQAFRDGLGERRGVGPLERGPQGTMLRHALLQHRIVAYGGFDVLALGTGQLIVSIGHQQFLRDRHTSAPEVGSNKACNAARPRASRLVKVPIGISNTSAASL